MTGTREHGWRYIPRPAQITSDARPGDYARGAALAREQLAKTRTQDTP